MVAAASIILFILRSLLAEHTRYVTETRLRTSEEEHRAILERAPQGIFRSSPQGKFITVNPALARILGYASARELLSCVTDLGRQVWSDQHERQLYIQSLERNSAIRGYECEFLRKNDAKVRVMLTAHVVRDFHDNVVYYEGFVEDLTERRELEQQFLQAQKMEAVGRLAGGVAHDFNNLLTVITGYTDLAFGEAGVSRRLERALTEIKGATNRAVEITGQLLAFSRKQVLQPRPLDLNCVVQGITKMLTRLLGEDIQLVIVLDPSTTVVNADPAGIDQIIMNLAVNARDAMPNGGTLTIKTGDVVFDEVEHEKQAEIPAGRYATLSISDTGTGIDPETKKHLFEPFFTTKDAGRGTGLGLSTVFGIVRQSGGFVLFTSELGCGTTFTIYLPRIEAAVQTPTFENLNVSPHGSETVLLVEDDPCVRGLNLEVLRSLGYQVIEAGSAAGAITAFRRSGPINLLITDVIMPDMNGWQLAQQLLQERPQLRVLYVSGYPDDINSNMLLARGAAFLQKPFGRHALATRIRQLLDASSKPSSDSSTLTYVTDVGPGMSQ
jgi:PAS domain S-box-containing protein